MPPADHAPQHSGLVPRKERFGWAWTVSACLHVVVFAGMFLGSFGSCGGESEAVQTPIAARLVRLGTPREERLLPRLPTQTPTPPAAKDAPVVQPGEKVAQPLPTPTPPKPTEAAVPSPVAPAAEAPKAQAKAPADAPKNESKQKLDDIMKQFSTGSRQGPADPLPGQLDGDPLGDAEDAAEGERYLALVQRRIQSHYTVPSTIPDDERIRLRAVVTIRVESNGVISDFRITKPSGNDLFDAALESAVRRASPLPPPPDHLRASMQALPINFRI